MKKEVYRVGIIGYGHQGQFYARNLEAYKTNMRLISVCDIDKNKLNIALERNSECKVYTNYIDLLDNDNLDVVLVVTPHYLHPTILKEAVKRGINVLSDKPMGVTAKAVRETLEFTKEYKNVKCGVLFNQRVNPLFNKIKEILNSGDFGKVNHYEYKVNNWYRSNKYYESSLWRGTYTNGGGGVLTTQSPHQVDMINYLFGKPKKVMAKELHNRPNISVEDTIIGTLFHENDVIGSIVFSNADAPGDERLVISGEGGELSFEKGKLTYFKLKDKTVCDMFNSSALRSKPENETIVYLEEDLEEFKSSIEEKKYALENFNITSPQHYIYITKFIKALDGEESGIIATLEDGLNEVEVANALYLSSWLETIVDVPCDEELYITKLNEKKKKEGVEHFFKEEY